MPWLESPHERLQNTLQTQYKTSTTHLWEIATIHAEPDAGMQPMTLFAGQLIIINKYKHSKGGARIETAENASKDCHVQCSIMYLQHTITEI